MADKARIYLEQGIPELKEFEKKKIFTKVCYTSLGISQRNTKFKTPPKSPGRNPIDIKKEIRIRASDKRAEV
jgi:hypothetical protein